MGNEQSSQENPPLADEEVEYDDIDYSEVSDEGSAGPLAPVNEHSIITDSPTQSRPPNQARANRPNEGRALLPRTPENDTIPTVQSIKHSSMMQPSGHDMTDSAKKKRRKRNKKRRNSISGTSSILERTATNESEDVEISPQLHLSEMNAQDLERVRSQEEEALRMKEPELFGHYEEASDTPDVDPVAQDDKELEESGRESPLAEEAQHRPALSTSVHNINEADHGIEVAADQDLSDAQDDDEDLEIVKTRDAEKDPATDIEDYSHSRSNSPSTTFDAFVPIRPQGHEDPELAIAQDTFRKQSGLKRKRNAGIDARPTLAASTKQKKRQRRNSYSIPDDTEQPSRDAETPEQSGAEDVSAAEVDKQMNAPTFKAISNKSSGSSSRLSKAKPLRNGTLDGFAKPIPPDLSRSGSLNKLQSTASSRRVEIRVPRSSSSSRALSPGSQRYHTSGAGKDDNFSNGTNDTHVNGTHRQAYTTPKGKGKASSDIHYVSPNKEDESDEQSLSVDNEDDSSEHGEMATTVAKRTTQKNKKHQKTITSMDSDVEQPPISVSSEQDDDSSDSADFEDDSDDEKPYSCKVCHRRYETNDKLVEHEKSGYGHGKLYQCSSCSNKYPSRKALGKHEKQTGHGSGDGYLGRTGKFTDVEKAKLERWRDNFCNQNDMDIEEFNNMITESCRKSRGTWKWQFITKQELLDEYYGQLPGRNKRSMIRFRERFFSNADRTKWTAEEDKELKRLVRQLGPKWVEIGMLMSRTQDSVNQRWRHKLNHGQKSHSGDWTNEETQDLIKTVEAVAQSSGISLEGSDAPKIPWETVSKRMESVRTAQQCSNKWRILTQRRIEGKFTPIAPRDRMPGSVVKTPSSMIKRTKRKPTSSIKKSTLRKKYKSSEKVADSDEEGLQQGTDERNGRGEDHSAIGQPGQTKRDTEDIDIDSPVISRNPLNAHTPAAKNVSMTQLLNGTQANTSATRASTGKKGTQQVPERPSPDIQMRTRPASSPLEMLAGVNNDHDSNTESDSDAEDCQSPNLPSNSKVQRSNASGTMKIPHSKASVQAESHIPSTPHETNDRDTEVEDADAYVLPSSQSGWATINGFKNRFIKRVMPGLTTRESNLSEILKTSHANRNDGDIDE